MGGGCISAGRSQRGLEQVLDRDTLPDSLIELLLSRGERTAQVYLNLWGEETGKKIGGGGRW